MCDVRKQENAPMKHARGILFSVPQKSHKWRRMACNCVYVSDPFPNPYEEAHAFDTRPPLPILQIYRAGHVSHDEHDSCSKSRRVVFHVCSFCRFYDSRKETSIKIEHALSLPTLSTEKGPGWLFLVPRGGYFLMNAGVSPALEPGRDTYWQAYAHNQ